MKRLYFSLVMVLCAIGLSAQTANVQIIHNSAIPGSGTGPEVDIYLNGNSDPGNPDLAAVAFRTATGFLPLPAGPTQIHIVGAGGDPTTDTVLYAEAELMADESYVVVAYGVVGSDETPFNLGIFDAPAQSAGDPTINNLAVFHGSPDAPSVIVDAKDVTNLFNNLEYGTAGQTTVPNADYIVDIKPAGDTNTVVARFITPLETLNAGGVGLTVFASGFLNESPAFGLFATLPDGTTLALPDTSIATLQVIHNSPSSAMIGGPAVDVFINGSAPGAGPLENIEFRQATPFIEVPGNVDFTFDVVPTGGTIDQSIFTLPAGELGNGTYIIMAHGIAGDATNPFNLAVLSGARQFASNADVVDVNAFHGSPDAPAVDVDAVGIGQIIENMPFGSFNSEGYLSLPPNQYYLGVRPTAIATTVETFNADLSGLAGASATVFASGFLMNPDGSAFGLFAATASGAVVELPAESVCRIQVVHDAPVAEFVDVWIGGVTKAVPDFEFETATPFLTFPVDSSISITAPGSSDTTGNFLTVPGGTLATGASYYIVAAGDAIENFGVEVYQGARESAAEGTGIDLQAFHGSPDAPAVDVRVRNAFPIFENLEPRTFGEDYVNVPEDLYLLDITLPGEEDALFTFVADLTGLEGGAALAFASGYATRSADIDSSFKLLVALPDGQVAKLPLIELGVANIVHASPAAAADSVDVYLDGLLLIDNFPYLAATGYVELPVNQEIRINTKNSTGPDDGNVLTIPAGTLQKDSVHAVVVYGNGTDDFPISVNFIDNARPTNTVDGAVDIVAFHGIPGVPNVDVRNGANLGFDVIIPDLAYGDFSGYLAVQPASFFFRFTPAGVAYPAVATFNTELFEDDESVILVATGNVTPEADYNLYIVLPDGSVFQSDPQALVQIVHNSPVTAVDPADIWLSTGGMPIGAIQDVPFRASTDPGYLPTRTTFTVGVAPGNSAGPGDAVANFDVTFEDGGDYMVIAYGGTDAGSDPVALGVSTTTLFSNVDGEFDLRAFHGSPDAGTVDVLAGDATVIDDFEYGTYRGYLALTNAALELSIADGTGTTVVGTFDAPVDEWINDGNTAGTLFASGLLSPEGDEPGFELWIAFPDGSTEMLMVITSTNELEKLLTGLNIFPNPATTTANVQYTLDESMELQMRIISNDGRIVEQQDLGEQPVGTYTMNIDAYDLAPGTYHLQMISERGSVTKRLVVIQ